MIEMRIKTIVLLSLATILPLGGQAQTTSPNVAPTATVIDKDGTETEYQPGSSISVNAPQLIRFRANPINMEDYNPTYEWHFQRNEEETEMMVRYEEDTEYTFMQEGMTRITLKVKLDNEGNELPSSNVFEVTVSSSQLAFPNAFSPNNGDNLNNTFKPKTCQSIVEFHAYIFNRWGQKLYDWTDPDAEGWDGTYNGKDVKDGVYFLLCKAKGSDGRVYNIRKDINLLRGYIEGTTLNN